MVCGGVVLDGVVGEACDELVGKTYTLCRTQRVAPGIPVVFTKGLVVVVSFPIGSGEDVAEWRNSAGGRGDSVVRAEVHKVDGVGTGEVSAREACIEARCDIWSED